MIIIIQPWKVVNPEKYYGYEVELRVLESTHSRFTKGVRFDYGFLNIAIKEGYSVIFLSIKTGDPE